MVYKILGGFIMIAAAALAYLTLNSGKSSIFSGKDNCIQRTPAAQLVDLIDNDFQNLAKNKELPAPWKSIATVEIHNGSQLAKTLLGKMQPKIQRVKNGTSYLELEILDLPDETNPGIIIQASLFDIKSKNKIFEIGRTYTMEDLNHQTAEKPTSVNNKAANAQESSIPSSQRQLPQQQAPVHH